ncbi:MAG: RDD family protein [Acidobacteriota bacterium]|nr:RDD family protein [Acidobacteriota bacterium]
MTAGHGAGRGSVGESPSGFQRARTGQGDNRRIIGVAGRPRSGNPSRIHRQQKLKLETLPPAPPVVEPPEPAVTVTSPPREILLSRILAAILDLSLAGLIGFSFCLLASRALSLDFFSLESFRLGGVCTAGIYLFTSFFFLLGAGQTPGMYFTRLRLVSEKQQESISMLAVALWIFLYPPVTLTLVGLLWGLIDPWRRCIHDRLSGTRVVSLVEPVSAPLPE